MKNNAFTLIEVLIAMTILTSCLFIIANLQTRALNKVLRERDEFERTFLIKRDAYIGLIDPPDEGKKTVTRYVEPFRVTLKTEIVDISAKSDLKDVKDHVKMLRTEAAWKTDRLLHENVMMSVVFKFVKKVKKG